MAVAALDHVDAVQQFLLLGLEATNSKILGPILHLLVTILEAVASLQ